jgi:hypothetical protein
MKKQEDEIQISNFYYFSKIFELADRADVNNCRQLGTPDSEIKHTKRGLSPYSSLGQESTVDEDILPIKELVYSIKKFSPRKSTRNKKTLLLLSVNTYDVNVLQNAN